MRKHFALTIICSLLLLPGAGQAVNDIELPVLGDTSSAMVSPRQERELGQELLKLYRSQAKTSSDYQLIQYLEELLFERLAPHSELRNPEQLSLVLVENPTINAFAAPGGVIGVHTGLIDHAQNEHQLASVLAHELAHLSQRHYARRLQQQKDMSIPLYAAMIGSIILAAAGGGDAGLAAMMSTQAAALDAQLRFSRQFEQEADRLGLRTMVKAGFDPRAASEMFEQMLRASRYTQRPPEFLLTHPVTQRRISDTRSRTLSMAEGDYEDNIVYHLMRARVQLTQAESPQLAVQRFKDQLRNDIQPAEASQYGLALAQMKAGQLDQARTSLAPLLENYPEQIHYQLLAANIDTEAGEHDQALSRLSGLLQEHPQHHSVVMHYGMALMKAEQFEESAKVFDRYSRRRQEDPEVWYWLAEVNGLAGNILGVHEARAEYFIHTGSYNQAIRHLRHALKEVEQNDPGHRRIVLRERLKQVEEMQRKRALL